MEHYPYPPRPTDRIDPFDTARTAEQFIVFGNGRWSYAATARPDLLGLELADWIPMGYNVLAFAQKTAVFRRGRLVRSWPLSASGPRPLRAAAADWEERASSWLHGMCGYRVAVPDQRLRRLEGGLAYDAEGALAKAEAAAAEERVAVLWFVYDAANWH